MIKIGVGIITCNRPDFVKRCYDSLPSYVYPTTVVVNDGDEPLPFHPIRYIPSGGKQVGHAKNLAMQELLNLDCDVIFTMEDDIFIKDPDVFWKYIKASERTGIQHFNFGFSQKENLDKDYNPVYRKVVDYGDGTKIVLTPNILGAFTFYTRQALQQIGLHHHSFDKGHGDHPELTYRAYKHGLTTPFWWFADLYESWEMIGNQSNMGSDSLVRNQVKFMENFKEACEVFKTLHGVSMLEVPDVGEQKVIEILKKLAS